MKFVEGILSARFHVALDQIIFYFVIFVLLIKNIIIMYNVTFVFGLKLTVLCKSIDEKDKTKIPIINLLLIAQKSK